MSSTECTDPLSYLPLNTTRYAGHCGIIQGPASNNTISQEALLACAPPCTSFSIDGCVAYVGAVSGDVFHPQTKSCGRNQPTTHFAGYRGVGDWTDCLIRNGLNSSDPDNKFDAFCVEPGFGPGMRFHTALSQAQRTGIGIGVWLGVSALVLSTAAAIFYAIKYRRVVGATLAKEKAMDVSD